MNSDDVVKHGLARVLGWYAADPFAKTIGTIGVYHALKNPYTRTWLFKSGANFIGGSSKMALKQTRITYQYLAKPAVKKKKKKIAQKYAAQRAASIVGPRAFGWGVGGAALSLAAMGIVIAEGRGQSGIQMAEGQKEYEEHAIRTGGGRQVVI